MNSITIHISSFFLLCEKFSIHFISSGQETGIYVWQKTKYVLLILFYYI